MEWRIDGGDSGLRQGRMILQRITQLMGAHCGRPDPLPPETPEGRLSGSWYDPDHSGEGYVVQVLLDRTAVAYWFSFDPEGNRRWFFGEGEIIDGKIRIEQMLTTQGGVFGPEFDPEAVVRSPWGSLELELGCNSGVARFEPVEVATDHGWEIER